MLVTDAGIVISVIPVQPEKAQALIPVKFLGSIISVSDVQFWNALALIYVTLSAIDTSSMAE